MGDDLTYEQLLAMLQGKYSESVAKGGVMNAVGAKGLDTPAERDFLTGFDSDNGVMDVATNYKNANATQSDYDAKMSYIDKDPALGGLDRMQQLQMMGVEAGFDTPAQLNSFMTNPTANTTNLGLGSEMVSAAEREKLAAIMGMGAHPDKRASFMETGVLPDGYLQKYGVGAKGLDTPAERDYLENNNFAGTGEANMDVDRASFNTNFENLTPEQKAKVTEMMNGMTDNQKKAFALGMTGKKGASRLTGYEVDNYNRLAY